MAFDLAGGKLCSWEMACASVLQGVSQGRGENHKRKRKREN